MRIWLVGYFEFNDSISVLYQAVSQRGGERNETISGRQIIQKFLTRTQAQ